MSSVAFERIQLPDYAAPSFVDLTKYYYGTKKAIDSFLATASEYDRQPGDRTPANVLGERSTTGFKGQCTHNNIYGFPYTFRWDTMEAHHVWIECDGTFCRCVRLQFRNLQYTDNVYREFLPVTSSWGLPGIIRFDHGTVVNSLYEIEKQFSSKKELLQDMENFNGGILPDAFFDDVLGDG